MTQREIYTLFAVAMVACGSHAMPSADGGASDAGASAANENSSRSAASSAEVAKRQATAEGLKVAFFGDQGVNPRARSVLQLIANEHAAAVIHVGDLAYGEAPPTGWDAQINDVLGTDFPYFALIGNHDVNEWPAKQGFAELLRQRLSRMNEAHCDGDYGVAATCTFRGLRFVMSGVGTSGSEHERYLDSALQSNDAIFQLCTWHKNQHDMQVGAKTDEVGWQAYQICAKHGVPVITGHEHSYARTQTLTMIGAKDQQHGATGETSSLQLAPGRTFVAVSGLGGESQRERTADHALDTWWASIYARNDQLKNGSPDGSLATIEYGALFVEFYVDGDPYKAHAYFKTVDGALHDDFTWTVPGH
jgi:hypothetical protein